MRKLSKMISFRASFQIADWLESFFKGSKTQTIHTILFVCVYCLSEEEFKKWRFAYARDLKNKKLVLIDDVTAECNTNGQGNCNTLQQLNSEK